MGDDDDDNPQTVIRALPLCVRVLASREENFMNEILPVFANALACHHHIALCTAGPVSRMWVGLEEDNLICISST